MSTDTTHREILSDFQAERWGTHTKIREDVLRLAVREARRSGATRIEILDERRNVLHTVEGRVRKPAPAHALVRFMEHDGGRAAAGFKGMARGDCVTRAICIAAAKPYREVYDALNELAQLERPRKGQKRSTSTNGVHRVTYERYLLSLGFQWVPTMKIGSGCKVHLRSDELPAQGRLVLSLSRHLAAWVDGVLYDTGDCSRQGTRCVYGYYIAPVSTPAIHPAELMIRKVA